MVDPAKLLEARKKGVGLEELRDRARDGEYKPDIEPEWTAGHRFSVVYDVNGSSPATHHLVVADGAPVIAGTGLPEGDPPAATLTVTRQAFLPLLARLALPPGERVLLHGDADAFAVVHRWTDRLQGIPTDD